jgi:hypothetical protein
MATLTVPVIADGFHDSVGGFAPARREPMLPVDQLRDAVHLFTAIRAVDEDHPLHPSRNLEEGRWVASG